MKYLYEVGDLVELARFGMSPERDEDKVYGTVLEVLEAIDYQVPRYRVRVQYDLNQKMEEVAEFHYGRDRCIHMMEYDIAGKIDKDSGASTER